MRTTNTTHYGSVWWDDFKPGGRWYRLKRHRDAFWVYWFMSKMADEEGILKDPKTGRAYKSMRHLQEDVFVDRRTLNKCCTVLIQHQLMVIDPVTKVIKLTKHKYDQKERKAELRSGRKPSSMDIDLAIRTAVRNLESRGYSWEEATRMVSETLEEPAVKEAIDAMQKIPTAEGGLL